MNFDLSKKSLTEVNSFLQKIDPKSNQREFVIKNPLGNHALCAGLQDEVQVTIKGHVGYYCAGMNKNANINKISKNNMRFASVLGHEVISLLQKRFNLITFLLTKKTIQASKTNNARISNEAIKKLYNTNGRISDKAL